MATVKVTGGSASIDSSTIINTGNTGTALWVEGASGSYNNIAVSNAAVGIQSYNAAPSIDGFTSTGNTVGIDAHGGMTLPTIYRSTSLENVARGWKTHELTSQPSSVLLTSYKSVRTLCMAELRNTNTILVELCSILHDHRPMEHRTHIH